MKTQVYSHDELNQADRLANFRRGWRLWCWLMDVSDCMGDDERSGYLHAAEVNENGGGSRPVPSEAREFTVDDLPAATPVLYLNTSLDIPGHYCFRDSSGKIATGTGPRESMLRIYIASGYDVRDEHGRRAA